MTIGVYTILGSLFVMQVLCFHLLGRLHGRIDYCLQLIAAERAAKDAFIRTRLAEINPAEPNEEKTDGS